MNADTLLDELNGRLTSVVVRYPDTRLFIWSYQKHILFALKNPGKAKVSKVIRKGRKWLSEVMWKHPFLRPEFEKMVEAIDRFELRHAGQLVTAE